MRNCGSLKKFNREIIVSVNNGFAAGQAVGVEETKHLGSDLFAGSISAFKDDGDKGSGFRELVSNALKFDIGALLRPRSFVYLMIGTGIILFQTYNTLAIINLAKQNERLREQIEMRYSEITSQELKVRELQSIHNIAQAAASLGLTAASVSPVELEP